MTEHDYVITPLPKDPVCSLAAIAHYSIEFLAHATITCIGQHSVISQRISYSSQHAQLCRLTPRKCRDPQLAPHRTLMSGQNAFPLFLKTQTVATALFADIVGFTRAQKGIRTLNKANKINGDIIGVYYVSFRPTVLCSPGTITIMLILFQLVARLAKKPIIVRLWKTSARFWRKSKPCTRESSLHITLGNADISKPQVDREAN